MLTTNFFLTLALVFFQATPSLDTLVGGVEKSLREMRDFSAGFEQIHKDSSNHETRSRGLLYLKRDGGKKMMRAHRTSPQERLYISDGKIYTDYSPQIKQALTGSVKDSGSEIIPFMMLLGEKNVFEPFERKETKVSMTPGHSILHLTPRDKKLPVVELEVNSKSFLVRQLSIRYPNGEQTTFIFTDAKANAGMSSSLFEFDLKDPSIQVIPQ
jgi:chaperone LolA